jgi:hypothetical protein
LDIPALSILPRRWWKAGIFSLDGLRSHSVPGMPDTHIGFSISSADCWLLGHVFLHALRCPRCDMQTASGNWSNRRPLPRSGFQGILVVEVPSASCPGGGGKSVSWILEPLPVQPFPDSFSPVVPISADSHHLLNDPNVLLIDGYDTALQCSFSVPINSARSRGTSWQWRLPFDIVMSVGAPKWSSIIPLGALQTLTTTNAIDVAPTIPPI